MHFGGAMFFTDYSMSAMELARAFEERGFESVWAPEHSHIPLSRKTPFPGGVPEQYYDAMDPFVVLAAGNEPARVAHLDDCNDRAILVQGDQGPAQSLPRRRPGSFGWGIAGTPSIRCSGEVAIPRRPPHSVSRSPRRVDDAFE